jgi:hypothetical protein
VNDDTELIAHWPAIFVNALHSLSKPFGVIGPTCKQGNNRILTHDFVHRTHMEIFEMNYYPPELVDWLVPIACHALWCFGIRGRGILT